MKSILSITILLFLLLNLYNCEPLIITRIGGLNNEYRSLEIDSLTGYFFNQANHKGKLSADELKVIQNIIDNEAFKNLKPKYVNPMDVMTSYRYTISYQKKSVGTTIDIITDYPKFLDPLFSIFELYSS